MAAHERRTPVRVLVLTRYSNLAASTRYRFLQYFPYLEQQGFLFTVQTLLDDAYLPRLYAGQSPDRRGIVRSYARRLKTLLQSRQFDLIWLHFDAFPWVPAWWESLALPADIPYVVDLDDAMFHRYDEHRLPVVRGLLGSKYDRLMQGAAAVVVGNQYIANRAVAAGASVVEVIPTVVDLNRYTLRNYDAPPSPVVPVGWIGSPATASNLRILQPALRRLGTSHTAQLVTVGSGDVDLGREIKHVVRPWSESTEIQDIHRFDVGTMPLIDAPFERGKSGFKLIQCMACGVPVIASPVGVNVDIIDDGANGFLAASDDEWYAALKRLADNPALRQEVGLMGRRRVEADYSLQTAAPRLSSLLSRLVAQ